MRTRQGEKSNKVTAFKYQDCCRWQRMGPGCGDNPLSSQYGEIA